MYLTKFLKSTVLKKFRESKWTLLNFIIHEMFSRNIFQVQGNLFHIGIHFVEHPVEISEFHCHGFLAKIPSN